jgi:hypothetical protein
LTDTVLGLRATTKAGVSSAQLGNFDIGELANRYGLCYSYTHQIQSGGTHELEVYFLPQDLASNVDTVQRFMESSPLFASVQRSTQ